jgi:hypothetical protein
MFEWIDKTLGSLLFGSTKRKNLFRNLLLECRYNLALLDLISEDLEEDDSVYLEVFRKLEKIQLQEFTKVFHIKDSVASAMVNVVFDDIEDKKYQTDLISNILVRIHVLNVIGQLHNTRGLKQIKYKTRAQNLKRKIVELIKYLSQDL